jgi:hypothetical protein
MPLGLPRPQEVESIPDPKQLLRETLAIASGLNGRRLERFRQRFPQHRRQLLERIDAAGRISDVASWRAFNTDLVAALKGLSK